MIPQELITKALQLTWKTIEDMEITLWWVNLAWDYCYEELSIEKFCYYLLSPEFIEKYEWVEYTDWLNSVVDFAYAITDYQKWNNKPLIELLSKI